MRSLTENRYKDFVMEQIPSLVSYVDKELIYRYVNPQYEKWFGLRQYQIIGKKVIDIIGSEAFEQIESYLSKALRGEKVAYETKMPYKSRDSLYIRTTLTPDFDDQEKVQGIVATVDDFSSLEDAHKKLSELDQAKSEFLKIISHELNTPLNGIIGFSSLLQEELDGTESKYFLNHIVDSAHRLLDLTQKALMITQLSSSTYKIQPEPGDLKKVLEHALLESNLKVELELPEHLPSVCFDQNLIHLSFKHLLENVSKHAGLDAILSLSSEENERDICIVFNDNGPGFTSSYLNYLFDFFASFDSKRVADQRYGLGLAFINLVMQAHDGEIQLMNNKSGGACVKLVFPKFQCPNN